MVASHALDGNGGAGPRCEGRDFPAGTHLHEAPGALDEGVLDAVGFCHEASHLVEGCHLLEPRLVHAAQCVLLLVLLRQLRAGEEGGHELLLLRQGLDLHGGGDGHAAVRGLVALPPLADHGREDGVNPLREAFGRGALLVELELFGEEDEAPLDAELEGLHNPLAAEGAGQRMVDVLHLHGGEDLLGAQDPRQVLLVALDDNRGLGEVQLVGQEVGLHVLPGDVVLLGPVGLGVRHEDDGVRARQDHLSGGVVVDLPGDRVDLVANLIALDLAEVEGEKIEEEGPVFGGLQRDKLRVPLGIGDLVERLQVGRLSA